VVSPGTPANEAYSSGRSSNRGALLGVAALVLIVLTVAVVAWQMMGDSGAAERFDPTTDARPQDLPARQEDPAGAPAAAGALEGDTATAGEAAGTGAEPPTSVVSPATSPSGDGGAAAIAAAQPAGTPTTIAGSEPTAAQPSPTPQQPATILQQQGSAQPQQSPADADETPAFIPPPVNSIVADTSGEYEYVDQVHVWFEKAFSEQSFEVVHYPSSPAASLQEAARFHLVTTARLVGTQQLEYFGNVQTQFTIALISRVTDLSTGATVVGPESKTIQYTSTNMQQNLERGTNELARTMARRLRQAMRAP
jgi:serine/threonine-protein kinase